MIAIVLVSIVVVIYGYLGMAIATDLWNPRNRLARFLLVVISPVVPVVAIVFVVLAAVIIGLCAVVYSIYEFIKDGQL